MGHAGRSLALIERLLSMGHRVTIFTFADAYRLLANSGYHPYSVNGLQFRVSASGGVNSLGHDVQFCSLLAKPPRVTRLNPANGDRRASRLFYYRL